MATADQIRLARERAGKSQGDLAEAVYGDRKRQSNVSRLERGEVSPTIETLERIADALDCELEVRFVPREAKPAKGFKRPSAGDEK